MTRRNFIILVASTLSLASCHCKNYLKAIPPLFGGDATNLFGNNYNEKRRELGIRPIPAFAVLRNKWDDLTPCWTPPNESEMDRSKPQWISKGMTIRDGQLIEETDTFISGRNYFSKEYGGDLPETIYIRYKYNTGSNEHWECTYSGNHSGFLSFNDAVNLVKAWGLSY